jgi:outer membrane protein OmpA-like peptidoglycan-associated protein
MESAKLKPNFTLYFILFGFVLTMGACASSHVAAPNTSQAASNIKAAQQAGARQYAPGQLRKAKRELKRARTLVQQKKNKKASKLTRHAAVDARLAYVTTLSKKAQQLQKPIHKLQQEMANMKATMTKQGAVLTFGDVLFNFGKADLHPGAKKTMAKLASFLNEHSNLKVLIEGYTDNRGSKRYNLGLSRRRANSVKQALTDDGVSASRINTVGYGEQYPVATNSTSAGRQLNRRVEVVISPNSEAVEPHQNPGMMTPSSQDSLKRNPSGQENVY